MAHLNYQSSTCECGDYSFVDAAARDTIGWSGLLEIQLRPEIFFRISTIVAEKVVLSKRLSKVAPGVESKQRFSLAGGSLREFSIGRVILRVFSQRSRCFISGAQSVRGSRRDDRFIVETPISVRKLIYRRTCMARFERRRDFHWQLISRI